MEVILTKCKNRPSCPHGPCLLFERYKSDGSKSGRRFFACSACRDRSECSFFQWADDEISEESKALWKKITAEKKSSYSHDDYMKQLEAFKLLPSDKQKYCKTCSLLLIEDSNKHFDHDVFENVTEQHLLKPSLLFKTHENKKVQAQYFFSGATTKFLISLLKDLGFSKLVSIGVPRMHEFVLTNQTDKMSSFLLDIDDRYMQFFNPQQFSHYNMFNNHFFGDKESKQNFKNYLFEEEGEKVVILLDPPFGGLIDAISQTLKKINKWWRKKNNKSEENVPIVWVFPYFHEGRILKNHPDMKMMDYKVEYENHKKFKNMKSNKSPIRVFTNIKSSLFKLPSKCGYRFCTVCERYVSEENQHCAKCNSCTTKHGKTYRHCDYCKQCVKSSHIHCQKCNKCAIKSPNNEQICQECQLNNSESPQNQLTKCFKCKGVGHKKQDCHAGSIRYIKRRKKQRTM